jgi:hypothetical protein
MPHVTKMPEGLFLIRDANGSPLATDRNNETVREGIETMGDAVISRRAMAGVSGLTLLALARGEVLGQEGVDYERLKEAQERAAQAARETARGGADAKLQERPGTQERAFFDRMRDSDAEGRAKMMKDWQFQRTLDRLRGDLGVSEEEWTVIRPRIEAVYRLVHVQASPDDASTETLSAVTKAIEAVRSLLRDQKTTPDQIRDALTQLRAAREKVKQELTKAQKNLRQIMTLRQEAILILNGLLD